MSGFNHVQVKGGRTIVHRVTVSHDGGHITALAEWRGAKVERVYDDGDRIDMTGLSIDLLPDDALALANALIEAARAERATTTVDPSYIAQGAH